MVNVTPKYKVTLLDAVVLLYHVQRGAKHPDVGFEDVDHTYKQLISLLTTNAGKFAIGESVLESALWSCNLMSEQGEFWSPDGNFKDWMAGFAKRQGFKFNTLFNTVTKVRTNGQAP